ncbi:acetylserotonin O-methyltransferase 3 [Setaria italica]|nr:acetylserotonin O-methyltransferase 3 [Setaria italica]
MNRASMADSRFTMEVVIKEAGGYFKGLKTLTDVGGGHGAATAAIVATFPDMQCTVMDLQQVVNSARECGGTVKFVVGNMFESIPPADAVLLKLVLHSWDDASCIKILKCCKEAIPPMGGKVFNINTVLGHRGETSKHETEAQLLLDLYMMRGHGFERDERQWKTIFLEVGFANYTVIPLQDPLAMIVLHPSPLVVEMTVKVTGTGGAKEDSFLSTDEAEAAP